MRRPRSTGAPLVAIALTICVTLATFVTTAIWTTPAYASTVTSPNWSGWVAQAANRFTAAVGQWTQPASTCTGATDTAAAFWVGLDGYQDQTVEQIGVQAKCRAGVTSYYAWWQMWPAPVHDLPISTNPVRASDVLKASVVRSGDQYTLSLHSSEGWHYTTTQQGSAEDSSAEWIASSPPLCHTCGYALLTDFGRVTFTDVEAATGGSLRPLGSFTRDDGPVSLTMTSPTGVLRAGSGPLGAEGRAFTVTWHHD